jgi:hypothetical protein
MRQVARTLTVADGGVCRVLICDRDATWSKPVRARLQDAGLRVNQTPYHAPNASANLGVTRNPTVDGRTRPPHNLHAARRERCSARRLLHAVRAT